MKRNYFTKALIPVINQELTKQTAIHEAGHAAAIYLRNKQQRLPPVFFRIIINPAAGTSEASLNACQAMYQDFAAKIEGGCLIHNLPICLIESNNYFSDIEKHAYQTAYEADIINLLAGPLAEAKYAALRDNEFIETLPIDINLLNHYGGNSDIKKVHEYLEYFICSQALREQKITECIAQARQFINEPATWRAITELADYIVAQNTNIIDCEQVIAVLDSALAGVTTPDILH